MELSTAQNRSRLFAWDVALLIASGAGATAVAGRFVPWIEAAVRLSHGAALSGAMLAGAVVTAASVALYATIGLPGVSIERAARSSASIPLPVVALVGASGLWLAALVLGAPFFNIYFTRTFALALPSVSAIFSGVTIATAVLVAVAGEVATRWGARRAFTGWLLPSARPCGVWRWRPRWAWRRCAICCRTSYRPRPTHCWISCCWRPCPRIGGHGLELAPGDGECGQAAAQFAGGSLLVATSFPILFALAGGMGLIFGVGVALLAWRVGRTT